MDSLFRNFELDRLSFWLGFITATLFWWLLRILRPRFVTLALKLRERIRTPREDINVRISLKLRNGMIRRVEHLHMAAPHFSLSELVVTPSLLAPPACVKPGAIPPSQDITEYVLPYMPDWSEMASTYGWPRFTLAHALQGDANLVITGHPGSGKTVTLAHLAIQIARREPLPGNLNKYEPLFVHIADIVLPPSDPKNILQPLINAISKTVPGINHDNLIKFLELCIHDNRAILLVDGMDELPPEPFEAVVEFLKQLLGKYPNLRSVATATPDFYDGLTDLGFIPVPMATWNAQERSEFINNWSDLWIKFVGSQFEGPEPIDPALLNAWLLNDQSTLTPLEQTLKIWATYAGDNLGPNPINSIEAYIQRMTLEVSNWRTDLENIALMSVVSSKPLFTSLDVEDWESRSATLIEKHPEPEESIKRSSADNIIHQDRSGSTNISDLLSILTKNGLLRIHHNSNMGFIHPVILSYLAGCAVNAHLFTDDLLNNPHWSTAITAIGFYTIHSLNTTTVTEYINLSHNLLSSEVLTTARWLRNASENAPWSTNVIRYLAELIQNEAVALGIRARAVSAIATSSITGVEVLFRKMITSEQQNLRLLGALGCGQIRDLKSVNELSALLNDPLPNVQRAACLALVAIGNSPALESVAEALLHGDEDTRHIAAEALANHPEEGYPALEEGATLDDVLVRRAVVFGLNRVNEEWATEILEEMQIKDEQWVVKTAAMNALEEKSLPNPRIPENLPALTETPWLIAFAGERGIGVAPGKPATNLLMLALQEGDEEQQLAALNYFGQHSIVAAVPDIYKILVEGQGEVRETALNTLWHLAAAGVELPHQRFDK